MSHDAVHIEFVDEGNSVSTFRRVAIIVTYGEITAAALDCLVETAKRLRATDPNAPLAIFTVAQAEIRLPNAAARAAMERVVRESAELTNYVASVVEGEGFLGSAIRSILTALIRLRKDGHSHKPFGSVTEAAHWLAGRFSKDPTFAMRLVAATEETRRSRSVTTPVSGRFRVE
jgi:hypothetical protein